MKKILTGMTATLLMMVWVAGCASPHEKAEKLAYKIEKESLTKEGEVAARPIPADPQPEHAARFVAKVAMTPVLLAARGVRDAAKALPDLATAPVHIALLPFQIVRDTVAFGGELKKAVFPPPRPKVS